METDLDQRLTALEAKIDKLYSSAEATRKMYLWSLIIGVALIVLPLIGLAFVLPGYLKSVDIQGLLQ